MCGFVAVIAPLDSLPRVVLDDMRDRLAHRGPDGARSWIGTTGVAAIGLGHRRLRIIDLSEAAAQPMDGPSGATRIVYNGEIYNYIELRRELEGLGVRFRTASDTEVLLAAYETWGVACLGRLNGMFAFALWDERTKSLFLARDRLGEKPLFYARLPNGGLAAASEMKALFAHPDIPARPDQDALSLYTAGLYYEDGEQTMFEGIERLAPAHALVVDADGTIVRKWRYWTPRYDEFEEYDDETGLAHFRTLLDRSIELRLRSDVPVGTSLSGGLDSSYLVCKLAQFRGRSAVLSQNTFSSRFDHDPTLSEGPYIDLVTKTTGVNAFAVTPSPALLAEESALLHYHQEEPFRSASIYLQWCVMRVAAEHDTTVLIDGQGADELLAGYQFYFRNYQLDRLDRHEYTRLLLETLRFTGRLRRAGGAYENSRRRFNDRIAYSLPALAALWSRRPPVLAGPYDVGVPEPVPGSRLRRQLAEALQYNSLPALLRYADRNAMAFSRETRFPYLDYDLVDWCTRLPDAAMVARGWQKLILRRACTGLVPRQIQWRADKVGYAAPLDVWLRSELRDWARERIFGGHITELEAYDRPALERLWREHQAGVAEHSWALWLWISLNEWLDLSATSRWTTAPAAKAVA